LIVIAKLLSWGIIAHQLGVWMQCWYCTKTKVSCSVLLFELRFGCGSNFSSHFISTLFYTCVLSETPLKALHKQIQCELKTVNTELQSSSSTVKAVQSSIKTLKPYTESSIISWSAAGPDLNWRRREVA
jgi:hypothetical protein